MAPPDRTPGEPEVPLTISELQWLQSVMESVPNVQNLPENIQMELVTAIAFVEDFVVKLQREAMYCSPPLQVSQQASSLQAPAPVEARVPVEVLAHPQAPAPMHAYQQASPLQAPLPVEARVPPPAPAALQARVPVEAPAPPQAPIPTQSFQPQLLSFMRLLFLLVASVDILLRPVEDSKTPGRWFRPLFRAPTPAGVPTTQGSFDSPEPPQVLQLQAPPLPACIQRGHPATARGGFKNTGPLRPLFRASDPVQAPLSQQAPSPTQASLQMPPPLTTRIERGVPATGRGGFKDTASQCPSTLAPRPPPLMARVPVGSPAPPQALAPTQAFQQQPPSLTTRFERGVPVTGRGGFNDTASQRPSTLGPGPPLQARLPLQPRVPDQAPPLPWARAPSQSH
ncbi:hypothetical protein L596_020931 [Steinernema carpocapsae]|uniref:Uncharacterized protein n=1 Tax=Steinernema carpocapsae TaxID=34508 RepID=A0A4V6A125_STECR|nr:hypothetical protein L596_020931 [Steinernema carpocapsae]